MTQNAWNSPYPDADGEVLIGSTGARPVATTLTQGSNVTITNGAGSITIATSAGTGDWVKISAQSASGSSSINFTGLSSTYSSYKVFCNNVSPATDGAILSMRTSTNNGSSYDSGASDYSFVDIFVDSSGTDTHENNTGTSAMRILGNGTHGMGSATNETGACYVSIFDPLAVEYCRVFAYGAFLDTSGNNIQQTTATTRLTVADVDAFQFLMSSGNIATGDFVLYGLVSS